MTSGECPLSSSGRKLLEQFFGVRHMTNADLISRSYRPSPLPHERVVEAPAETKHTVTRSDLADSVFRRIGLSRLESAQLVEIGDRRDRRCDFARRKCEALQLRNFPAKIQARAHRPQSQDRRRGDHYAAQGAGFQGLAHHARPDQWRTIPTTSELRARLGKALAPASLGQGSAILWTSPWLAATLGRRR